MRSLTLLAGFWLSSLASTWVPFGSPAVTRLSRTSGVRPIRSVTSLGDPHGVSCRGSGPELEGYPGWRAPVTRAAPRRARWRSSPPAARTRGPGRRSPADLDAKSLGPHAERAPRAPGAHAAGRPEAFARSIPKAAQAARSRSPGAPRAAVMRVPKIGTGRADLEARRAGLLAREVLDHEAARRWRTAWRRRRARLRRGAAGAAPRTSLKTAAWSEESRKRAARRSRGQAPASPARSAAARSAFAPAAPKRWAPKRFGSPRASSAARALGRALRPPRGRRRAPPGGSDSRAAARCAACGRGAAAASTRRPGSSRRERGLGLEARHREPLARDGDAVLAARVADVRAAPPPPPARARAPTSSVVRRRFSTSTKVCPPSSVGS